MAPGHRESVRDLYPIRPTSMRQKSDLRGVLRSAFFALSLALALSVAFAGAFLLLSATFLLIGNLMADIALAWLDPRIRYD